jgi:alpha-D-xyloside xylohydrolase
MLRESKDQKFGAAARKNHWQTHICALPPVSQIGKNTKNEGCAMISAAANRLTFSREGESLVLEPYGPDVIRVRSTAGARVLDEAWTLLPPAPDCAHVTREAGKAVLRNGKISAEMTDDGHICYFNDRGGELLREQWAYERDLPGRWIRKSAGDLFKVETLFVPQAGEHFYGMGQESHDLFDLKGSVIELCQQNTKSTIPFVVSSRGYGLLWNNPGIGRVEFGASRTRWVAEAARQMDYLVIAGGDIPEIVRRYSSLTGYAPEFPDWALGLWQSKLRYETQEQLLEVAREYKRRGIPLSMIVCDYFHWPQQGDWKFDPRYWPDPAGMVRELNEIGVKLLVSIWPTVDPRSENYEEMRDRNMLIRTDRGPGVLTFCRGPETYFDATNPEARAFVWDKIQKNYYAYGVRNFWLDESEPEIWPYDYDNLRYCEGNGLEVSNLYPFYYAKAFYDGQRAGGQNEILNLIRCAFIGSQRFGVVLWTGDIRSDFDSLRRQIKAGLHVSLCGMPWWTTDIGGFHGGDRRDEGYRECFVRWFQFGAFCPVFRMHGNRDLPGGPKAPTFRSMDGSCPSGDENEIWSYGETAYGIMRFYVNLRERLRPYIGAQMHTASQDGTPVMRPLFYDFPQEECYGIFDQYMFGPSLMACPIHEQGRRARRVFLPAGADWTDARTRVPYAGGQWIETEAPLDWMPLFLRAEDAREFPKEWFDA